MQPIQPKLSLTFIEAKQINDAIWEAFNNSNLSPDMVSAIKLAWETVDTFVVDREEK